MRRFLFVILSSGMRPRRIGPFLAVVSVLTLSGCGYVHFGRVPEARAIPAAPLGDEQLLKENSNLRTEKKILQQELALTRAQGDALRMAIENRTADGDTSKRLTEKLTQTTRELAALRADYAKLQLDRGSASPTEVADLKSKLGATEDKLASSLKNYTQLQEEIGRLRTDLDKTRMENTTLTAQVKVVTAKNEEVQAALAQLNSDLLAQKNYRTAVEQDAETLRTQLATANTRLTALAQQRTAPAADARALNATGSEAELRGQLDTLRKQVWTLESERNDLQQKLSALETAGKTPGLAEIKARAESESKLTAALEGAKMLRAENDQLKSSTAELTKTKAELEVELTKARAAFPLAAQAQTLREQLQQVQSQAASLADENSKLKARLAVMGGAAGSNNPLPAAAATAHPSSPAPAAPVGGVTATFVTNVPGAPTTAGATANANFASAAASARNRTVAATSPSGVALRFHTVTSGDTLSKISNTYYGTATRWAEILVANRDILGEDNNLVIGRTLRIP